MSRNLRIPHAEYPRIFSERKSGRTFADIAEEYGVTPPAIRAIIGSFAPRKVAA